MNALLWKKAAKRWRKTALRERDRYWRTREALREVGITVLLGTKTFNDEYDRTTIRTKSSKNLQNEQKF